MRQSEPPLQTLDQNLQLILDRYSLVGENAEFDIDRMNGADPRALGQRANYLYGTLTSRGLVHVWADPEKSDYCSAEVLVIDHSFVSAGSHIFNRRNGGRDWAVHTGSYSGLALASNADTLSVMPYELAAEGRTGLALEQAQARYTRVARALTKFATASSVYDALHQTHAFRYPPVHRNVEQLYPYAGQTFGPRINVQEMLEAGIAFHPAVTEALHAAPAMTFDSLE